MIDRFFSYMIDRIQQFIDGLQIDTSRASLGVWIAAINVAIVLLLVGGISISAIGSLRDLADQQGKSRVQLAGAMAREDLRRYSEDALTHAKGVAERQTFQRLLADRRAATIGPYLRRSCNTDTIASCAVFEGGALVAQAGVELPWEQIAASAAEQGERFMAVPTGIAIRACLARRRRSAARPSVASMSRACWIRRLAQITDRTRRYADPA